MASKVFLLAQKMNIFISKTLKYYVNLSKSSMYELQVFFLLVRQ